MDGGPLRDPRAGPAGVRNEMNYRLAIFDLDGTLADSFPWFLGIVNSLADRHNFRPVRADEIEGLRGKTSREIVRHFRVPLWRMPFIAADVRRRKARDLATIPLFPGVDAMLSGLAAKGVVCAVVSSDSEDNVRRALKANARSIAHFACGASLFGKAKKFRQVLRRSGIPARETIAIGDEVRDAEAAAKAGIAFGAVTWGYARADALQRTNPAQVFARMEEIAERLGRRA
jgi:phosphoglycolate phosphatase